MLEVFLKLLIHKLSNHWSSNTKLNLSIDASNLLLGGGLKHAQCLLANIKTDFFSRVIVYAPAKILEHLPQSSLIEPREISAKTSNLVYRFKSQKSELGRRLHADKGVLFVPGGAYLGDYRPFVTMFRNMQIFESKELHREGFSKEWIRLRVLQSVQAKTFLNSSGLICISEYAENYLKQFYPRLLTKLRSAESSWFLNRANTRKYNFDGKIRLLCFYRQAINTSGTWLTQLLN